MKDDLLDDVRLRQLEEGEFFLTRATKLHGIIQKREFVELLPGEETLAAIAVEIMGADGVLHFKLLHPDVRVTLVDVSSPT